MNKNKRKSARERTTKEATLKKAYGRSKKGDKIEFNVSIEKELKKKGFI